MITAVDVGATKTLIAQFNDAGEPVNHLRFETPSIAADWIRLFNQHMTNLKDVTSLAIGLPGQVSGDGSTVLYCGNLPWRDIPLKKMLSNTYTCPIYLENDAAMAGLSEINALPQLPRVGFYLTLGTGIGGAIIVDGKLISGLNRCEPGHMLLKHGATWKEWEDLASGKAIVAHYGKLAQDLHAAEEWQWLAENVAQGLMPVIATILPQTVVVGGGVGHYFGMFQGYLAEKLHRRLPDYLPVPTLLAAKRADEAVLYGCYHHATHQTA
ncbi:MAG TPA: ROK family protein [Magnetospirillaceae bacterium]|nr:ROK family protein [Magnetospirillaceae bacterium]